MIFELVMCVLLPIIDMALRTRISAPSLIVLTRFADYVVQGHRFDILEDFGCNPVRI